MAAKKSTPTPVKAQVVVKPVAAKAVASKPVIAAPVEIQITKAKPIVAPAPVIAPVVKTTATPVHAAKTPVAEATVAAAPAIEDVVGISPAMETVKKNMAELPKRISAVVTDIKKSQTEVNTHMEKVMKSAEELVAFGQGNVEAFVKSSQIWATGMQDLSKHIAAAAQASMDESMASVKALTSVKSFKEAIDLQGSMAKTAMEKMVAETGKLTDASMKLAEQAMAPITARVSLATEKFTKAA